MNYFVQNNLSITDATELWQPAVGQGKLADVVYFDFTKDFGVVSHTTFTAKLVRYRLNNWEIRLLENCLGRHASSMAVRQIRLLNYQINT